MTDYSLWEVILNGDSPSPTRIVDGAIQIIAPTTAEQRLAKKKKLKARGNLLMALLDKHQLKFNIHKDARTLMEAIEKRFVEILGKTISQEDINQKFLRSLPSEWKTHTLIWKNKADLEEQSLDDLFNNLKIYEAEVKDLKQIDPDDLEEIDLKWQMAMLTMRARRFLKRTGRNIGANGMDTIRFDMSKVKSYNWHRRGHFARECRLPRDNRNKEATRRPVPTEVSTSNALEFQCDALMAYASSGSSSSPGSDNEVAPCSEAYSKAYANLQTHYDKLIVKFRKSQFDVLSYKTGLESVQARLVVYQKSENVFEEDINLLKLDVMLRDNVPTSSKNVSKLLESQVSDKTSLGFDSQVFNSQVFNCEELHNYESNNSVPKNPENYRYKTGDGYHAVPPPYTGTFMPPKPDLVFNDAPTTSESVVTVFNVESSINKPSKDMSKTLRPDAPIIEDWISDSEDETENESVPKQKKPSFYSRHSKTPKDSVKKVEHLKQAENLRTNNQQPLPTDVPQSTGKSPRPVIHVVNKAHSPKEGTKGNAKKASANWVWKPKYKVLDHVSRLTKINRGYVAFGGNPKGGKISSKGKIKTGKLDFDDVYFVKELRFNLFSVIKMCDKKNSVLFIDAECVVLSFNYKLPDQNYVLLRVPRKNNMYNVDLKNVVPLGDLTCMFAKATLDESSLWHRRLGHINFKNINKLVNGNLVRGLPSNIFENNHSCVACQKGKQHRASCKSKPIHYYISPFELRQLILPAMYKIRIGPKRLFDIDTLTKSMNYQPVVTRNQPNDNVVIKEYLDADADVADTAFDVKGNENDAYVSANGSTKTDNKKYDEKDKRDDKEKSLVDSPIGVRDLRAKFEEFSSNNTNSVNAVSAPVIAVGFNPTNNTNRFNNASPFVNAVSPNFRIARKYFFMDPSKYPDDPDFPELEDVVYSYDEEDVGAETDLPYLETIISIGPILTTRVYKDHPITQIIGDLTSAPQTRSMTRMVKEQGGLHQINDKDFRTCMFACFLSQEEPKKVLVDLPKVKSAIGSKWVFMNKKDKRVIVTRNKARLVAHGHTQEEGIGYDEAFAPVVRIKAIRLFLAYTSIMGFMVYQMDVKSAFVYGTFEEEVYVCKPLGFEDLDYLDKVYKVYVDDIIFRSTNKELCKAFEKLMKDKFQMSSMGELIFFLGLQVKQKNDGIFISHDKYIAKILRKFGFTDVKSASTPIETEKPLIKDLDAYSDSDYAGASIDRKSTTRVLIEAQQHISNESPLLGVNTPRCNEDSIELIELMVFMCLSAKRTAWNEFSCSMASVVICLATVQPQPQAAEEEEEDPTPTPHATPHASPPQEQPTSPHDFTIPLLTILMETCVSLSQKVADLEQDKYTQALEILKLKKRVKKLEKKKRLTSLGFKRLRKVTINQEEVNAASKGVNAAEPTVFDDVEVTITMDPTLIKIPVEKAKLLDEQIVHKLHDEEV
uniref:Putative ribonuclease H-like domain-containing protein n=1 Tax=Tanacetum cinerariifolium TaxID=118510 RepID=A0A6L2JWE0_TANCI|nr:putative ribonuclease H-like domain-containing protein [Tanacetum cinerariifolium]